MLFDFSVRVQSFVRAFLGLCCCFLLSGCGRIYEESGLSRGMALLSADAFGLQSQSQQAVEIDASSDEQKQEKVLVYFSLDGYGLQGQDTTELDRIAQTLKQDKDKKCYIDGYTCELGGVEYNVGLGYKRARAVSAYLIDKGVFKSQLMLLSYGKEKPLDPGHTESSRKKNRRVEVSFVPHDVD